MDDQKSLLGDSGGGGGPVVKKLHISNSEDVSSIPGTET